MAATLASESCYWCIMELANHGTAVDNLGFTCSISNGRISKFERHTHNLPMPQKEFMFQVEKQQTEVPKELGVNGQPVKMVSMTELIKQRNSSINKAVNGANHIVNGVSIVKRGSGYGAVKRPKVKDPEGFHRWRS